MSLDLLQILQALLSLCFVPQALSRACLDFGQLPLLAVSFELAVVWLIRVGSSLGFLPGESGSPPLG